MAYSTFLTLQSNKSYPVDFDFSRYRYRVYVEYTDSVYGISIRAFINGVYNALVVSDLVSGTYANIPEMVGSRTYDITASESGSRGVTYLQREAKNTAPTTPGAFKTPTGELEIGDVKVVSWGASNDPNGDVIQYVLDVSVNGGAWSRVIATNATTHIYTIPTANTLKFRVWAIDGASAWSGSYQESATFTVTKPKYYWSKYNVRKIPVYYKSAWYYEGQNLGALGFANSFKDYSLDTSTGIFSTSGGTWGTNTPPVGSVGYAVSGTDIVRYTITGGANYDVHSSYSAATTQDAAGTLVQSGIIAIEGTYPTNGKHSDGFWYIRGSRVNQSIVPTGAFTAPVSGKVFKPSEVASITFTASSAPNISLYEVDYKYGNGAWQTLANNASLTRTLTITTDKALVNVQFRVRAKNTSNMFSDYVYSDIYTIEHNAAPTVNLTTPSNNQTLYEKDTYIIDGTVLETNVGDTVTVRYQIGAGTERAIKAYLSTGALETFGKQLTFRGGSLYDGDTLIASDLTDGVPHTLKVWATDDKGGTSAIVERTFYVVPNRVPLLTVNTPVIEGNIDADLININGTFSDPDANNAVVSYRINGGNSIQIAEGVSGVFDYTVSFGQLQAGENTIAIEVIDSYGAKTSKTIKLNKKAIETPLLKSTQRYQLLPPSGSAVGVLFYIQRDVALDVDVSISMTQAVEAEQYIPLEPVTTAPISHGSSIVEDEYYHAADNPAEKILLQIDFTRTSLTTNEKIYVVMGAFE